MKLMSVAEASEATHRHAETITHALRRGDLHGYQKMKRSPWVIQEECALAWRLGQMCDHQMKEAA